jgi:type IV secretory pathway TraG/TraD family ATPase VirD4
MTRLVILLVIPLLLALAATMALGNDRRLPRHRVRAMRLRLRLRRRPGKGHASLPELWLRWGRLAAFRESRRTRPGLGFWARARYAAGYSIALGVAQYWHAVRVSLQEHLLILAPPRTGKTALLARIIMRHPGPVVSTTTKHDVFLLTSGLRERRAGRVHVFNPQCIGGAEAPSTFRWNPVNGCTEQAVAIRRADAFARAVSQKGMEDGSFWSAKASDYLRAYFHAAALVGGDMRLVARWVGGAEPEDPESILRASGAEQWAVQLAELRGEAQKTAGTIRMTMSRAVACVTDPALMLSVLPGPGEGFDFATFLANRETLYLIAEAQGDDSPVAPLFACFCSELHYAAALIGQASPGARLDPPLLMALDEVCQVCPVPLPSWLADSGGKGITIAAVGHGIAQFASRYNDHGARVIQDTCGVTVMLPGITDPATLEHASKLCGQAAYVEHGQEHHSRHDVMTPDMIRALPPWRALIIRAGCASPVVAKLARAWRAREYKRARRQGWAVARIAAAPAGVVPEIARAQSARGLPPVARLRPVPDVPDVAEVLPAEPAAAYPWGIR